MLISKPAPSPASTRVWAAASRTLRIGAYHLAAHPAALFSTELGQGVAQRIQSRIGTQIAKDLHTPHVVVLPCDNMTPWCARPRTDGPAVNPYERFLWRLFEGLHAFERQPSTLE